MKNNLVKSIELKIKFSRSDDKYRYFLCGSPHPPPTLRQLRWAGRPGVAKNYEVKKIGQRFFVLSASLASQRLRGLEFFTAPTASTPPFFSSGTKHSVSTAPFPPHR